MAFTIFGQRLAIPFGASYVSPVLPLVFLTCFYLYRRGAFVEDRVRTLMYVVGSSACITVAIVSFTTGLPDTSITSLMLLVVVYAPFCLVLRPEYRWMYRLVLQTFLWCSLIIGGIAIAQLLVQLVHVSTYRDYIAMVIPQKFLVQDYQAPYPIVYGSSILKSNGLFCLEASLCSQVVALGAIIGLVLEARRWKIVVLLVALLSTVSGTGFVLLLAGLAVQMVRRGARWSARVVMVALVLGGLSLLTPLGKAVEHRVNEFQYTQTSGNQRFIAPYQRTWADLGENVQSTLTGHGPGYGDREAQRIQAQTGLSATSPPLPKLLTEYGLFAGLFFAIAVVVFLTVRTPSPTLSAALVVFYFLLSSSLLQAQTIYVSWLLASVFARPAGVRFEPRRRLTARPAAARSIGDRSG